MAVQSQIPRLQTVAPGSGPSSRSTPSPEPKANPKSKILSGPGTPSARPTTSFEPKATPKSKIPSQPQTPSSSRQSHFGWRPTEHWKPPGAVDLRSHPSSTPDSPNTSRLPRLTTWLSRKTLPNQNPAPQVSPPSPSNSQEPKRDWKDTWWGDSSLSLLELMQQQNPHTDRSPAVVGEPDNSKRFIKLLNPYGRPIGPESQDPVPDLVYPKNVDWFEREDIAALNKWRKAVFEHYLGAERGEEVGWCPEEDEFLLREYEELLKAVEEGRGIVEIGEGVPSWARITRGFNRRFEGRVDGLVTRGMLRRRYVELRNSGGLLGGD
ncbi:MAG: hypothetical protein Q9195_006502 [Heterodermia aff. obscurata]